MEQNLRQTKTMNYECKLQSEAKQHNFPPPDPRRELVPVLALRQPTGSAPRSQSAALTNEKYTKKDEGFSIPGLPVVSFFVHCEGSIA